jgi:phosphoglycolate phosphatase
MIRAIAFDFDGVLFESVGVKTEAFRKLFSQEPKPLLAQILEFHIRNGGLSRFEKFKTIYRDILRRPLDDATFQLLCQRFAQLVVKEVIAAPWVPGAREFLETQRGRYQFFVVSATPQDEIREIVRQKGIGHYFVDVLGSPQKKADLLADLMRRHRLRANEMVYVGDALNDWHAAREQGVAFVWRRADETIAHLPDFPGPSIPTLAGLAEVIA